MTALTERPTGIQPSRVIEAGRGVYDADRAACLAGVPKSTLHYGARQGIYRPSVSPDPRVRLWSWADLLALRTIDWLRRQKGGDAPPPVSMRKIRTALQELEREGISPDTLRNLVAVSQAGDLFFLGLRGAEAVQASPARQT